MTTPPEMAIGLGLNIDVNIFLNICAFGCTAVAESGNVLVLKPYVNHAS